VSMQNERSQHKNRDMAWKVLKSRLYELELRKQQAARDKIEASKADISFGSQIRNYVLAPYRMVKDVRTGVEAGTPTRCSTESWTHSSAHTSSVCAARTDPAAAKRRHHKWPSSITTSRSTVKAHR